MTALVQYSKDIAKAMQLQLWWGGWSHQPPPIIKMMDKQELLKTSLKLILGVPWPPGLAMTFVETAKYRRNIGWFC